MLIHTGPERNSCWVALWQSDHAHLHSPDLDSQASGTQKILLKVWPSHTNHTPLMGREVDIRTLEFRLGTLINSRLLFAFSLVLNMLAAAELLGLFVGFEAAG